MPEAQQNLNQNSEAKIETPVIPDAKIEAQTDDLTTLFTEDEIKAKKESVTNAKVEEERRSKLSKEELAAEDKKKADAEGENKVPETYADFKIPDGMKLDKGMLAEALPIFKEMGFTQKEAQRLVSLYSEKIGPAFVKAHLESWEQQKKDWYAETVANKEIKLDDKGANLDGHRVINTLFSADEAKIFKTELVKYGLDNHPWINLLMTRAAKHLKEDTIETNKGGGSNQPARSLEDLADKIYPDKK